MSTEKGSRKMKISITLVANILIVFLAFFVLFISSTQASPPSCVQGACESIFQGPSDDHPGYCSLTVCGSASVVNVCNPGFYPYVPTPSDRYYDYSDKEACDDLCPRSAPYCRKGGPGGPVILCCSCARGAWPAGGTRCEPPLADGCTQSIDYDSMDTVPSGDNYCQWSATVDVGDYCYSCDDDNARCHCVKCKPGFVWDDVRKTCVYETAECPPTPCSSEGEICFPSTNAVVQCVEGTGGCYYVSRVTQNCDEGQYCSNADCHNCNDGIGNNGNDGVCHPGCEAADPECNCEPNGKCGVGCTAGEDPDCGAPCNAGSCDGVCVSAPGCNDPDCCIYNDDFCCQICIGNDNDCGSLTFGYDPAGNLISYFNFIASPDVFNYYYYNNLNRLTNFSQGGYKTSYLYDYTGKIVRKTASDSAHNNTAFYLYEGDNVFLQESYNFCKCSDGTSCSQCNSQSQYCDDGVLRYDCYQCGCPSGGCCERTTNRCSSTCIDGTPLRQCSVNKPKYCGFDDGRYCNLFDACVYCGCPAEYDANGVPKYICKSNKGSIAGSCVINPNYCNSSMVLRYAFDESDIGFPVAVDQTCYHNNGLLKNLVKAGDYGSPPWGTTPNFPYSQADWLWRTPGANDSAPVEEFWVKGIFSVYNPNPNPPKYTNISITVDNNYTLYIDDQLKGSDSDWTTTEKYSVNLYTGVHTLKMRVGNVGGGTNPAGFILAIKDPTEHLMYTQEDWSGGFLVLWGNYSWVPGKDGIGKAMSFDGKDDRIEVSSSKSLNITNGLAISALVKFTGNITSNYGTIVKKEHAYILRFDKNPIRLQGIIFTGSTPLILVSNKTNWNIGEWYNIIFTYDKRSMKLYVNNVLDSSMPWTTNIATSNEPLSIGNGYYVYGGGWNESFPGVIDELRIYPSVPPFAFPVDAAI